jgi:hypothetical protein
MPSLFSFRNVVLGLALCLAPAGAATLERMEPEKMIEVSTEIVRGKVLYCSGTYRPPVIWTLCEVAVTERFKGAPAARVLVAVPGGVSSGIRQSYAGAPVLERDREYLFFLWQGKSGMKQIVGLCQGLLTISKDAQGNLVAFRGKTDERMLDAAGKEVQDSGLWMRLHEMRAKIKGALE